MENPSILPLVEKWEQFIEANKSGTVEQFAVWVLQQDEPKHALPNADAWSPEIDPILKNLKFKGDYPGIPEASGLAGYMLVRLFKALRFYFKPLLQKHELSSIDDFFFLATLTWKKALCQINMTDTPTGMDIIKRLVKQQLVSEKENTEDKREKLLTLTEMGQQKIYAVFSEDYHIQDVMADMSIEERGIFITSLDRLNHFHTKIYNHAMS
jgi:hypothetical protein